MRAKEILRKYADGHKELSDVLISREVIYTEDVERIFGKRPWVSRTDEIFAGRQLAQNNTDEKGKQSDDNADDDGPIDVEAEPVNPDIPPIPEKN